jgi:hypothetical protein
MKPLFIVCALVAGTIATSGCMTGDGGTASVPFGPFGTEPVTRTGSEPSGASESLSELCVRACASIHAGCPSEYEADCPTECAAASPPGCEMQFRAFVQCIAMTPVTCDAGGVCPQAAAIVNSCADTIGMPGGAPTAPQ